MAKQLIQMFFQALWIAIPPATMKEWMDEALDLLENKIAESPTEWDDIIILPVIDQMRVVLDIPDNDE